VNLAIRYIISLYQDKAQVPIKPTSVIIIGHSMGGIVSRQLFLMPHYLNGSVNTIITLATPHLHPPIAFERKMVELYSNLNTFWSNRLTDKGLNSGHEPNHLEKVMLVSLSGGNCDAMIDSGSSAIESVVAPRHGFSVASTGMKNVWASSDHRCILWCNQLVIALVRGLYGITDSASKTRTIPLHDRVKNLSSGLRYEFDGVALPSHSSLNQFIAQDFTNVQLSSGVATLTPSPTPHGIPIPSTLPQHRIKILIDGNSLPQKLGVCFKTSVGHLECSDITNILVPLAKEVPSASHLRLLLWQV
jgi:hypothetical protein